MIKKITYENKVSIQNDENIARKNKVTDEDMNEIKEVVNCNTEDFEIAKTDILNLKENIETIETNNTEKEKIISDLKEENERLKEDLKGLPKGQASGESIDLNDSAEMRMLEFEIGGNSRQESRSGKNLLKLKQISETKNGLDIIVENGKIIINGTCNEVTQIQIYNSEKEIKVNGNYYFSTNVKNVIPSENYTWINIYNGTTQIGYLDTMSEGKSFEFEEQAITQISFAIKGGAVCNNLTFEFQLEKGVKTEFEPYGVSPSPEYPSEVESCGDNGNINVEICNRNILDTSTIKIVKNQNNESRNGYYCKIPKTGQYSLILNTANTMYFGKSNNINSATTLIGSTNETFSTIYDFNKGEYFVIWGTKTDSDKVMVKLKNSQEDYIEHECQTYTIPIQQPMLEDDYFNLRNKQEIHIWEKVTISGTDLTSTNCSIEVKTNTVQCNLMNVLTNSLAINENKIKSNLFISKYGDLSDTEHIRNGSSSFPNNVVCNISKSNLTSYDLTGVQNLLNEKNLNIWYKLSTPKKILCTQEQSEILDKIENEAKTYKGVTHIYSTDKISPNMKVTYLKDIEIMLQGNEVP